MSDLHNKMKPVFEMATTGFEKFYNEATNKSSKDYSKSASSGNYSKSASSGNYSQSASSGNYSQSASSGYYSQSASSGDYSTSASSGTYSQSASSGGYSGYGSKSASSGDYSQSASSGYYSQSASSGYYSQSASSGDYSTSASSGTYSQSASSGGYSACSAIGYRAAVKGDMGNLLMASEYVDGKPVGGLAALVDGKTLKPQRWYIVERAKWVEVDFTDNIFAYVLSTKQGVKKVKTNDGDVLYIVSDGNGNNAHGKTIKEAREALIYKATVTFDGKLPESATGAEWVAIYRAATGACPAGVQSFVKGKSLDLSSTYTIQQVAELTRGEFGNEILEKLWKN